ncbi:MAG TPA: hypothetical protein VKQ07_02900, partial [Jatrophihabitantaceae bacterium]|nr:hypothetical protein [Jatrophihabitantaceae bacterium]
SERNAAGECAATASVCLASSASTWLTVGADDPVVVDEHAETPLTTSAQVSARAAPRAGLTRS